MTEQDLGGWTRVTPPPVGPVVRRWLRHADRAWARLRLLVATAPRVHDPMVLLLGAVIALSALFLAFPAIDLAVASLFYRAGEGFAASQDPALKAFRKSSDVVLGVVVLGLFGHLGWVLAHRGSEAFMVARRTCYLLVGLAVGPGLVVNGILKSHWGRPRPVAVDVFGGEAPYQSVWRISHWCHDNCSFVSGEASSSVWFVAALVLVPARYRVAVGIPVVIYAVLLSANRIAFGGHFLSDVVLSWTISGLVFAALYRLMVSAPGVAHRVRARQGRGSAPNQT
jgi:membrane-associated PAP2 superfamily phosphatase